MMDLKEKKVVHNIGIATSGINFSDSNKDYKNWDILQYEYCEDEWAKIIYHNYAEKKHILHSILLNVYKQNIPVKNAGYLISECLKRTNANLILFSTSSFKHLIENIKSINSYY